MSTELAVLVIHGMGSQVPDFAEDIIEELNDRIYDSGMALKGLRGSPYTGQISWKVDSVNTCVMPRDLVILITLD